MWQRAVMRCSRDGGPGGANNVLNGEAVEQVAKFEYLGVDINAGPHGCRGEP